MEFRQALPVGSVVGGDYNIVGVLGQGGFGLTYKAVDSRLGSAVAIKEYFPSDMALREEGSTVRAKSSREEGVFEWGRAKFLEEARTLARFRHPNIVRVARLFEANNTAYMVLDFEEGPNLAQWRAALGRAPPQGELDRIAQALLDAVEAVHKAGILHRDIKPANVIMRDGTEPILIDFGAARQSLGARSKTVHAIVTPGYSPKEQYALDVDRQGTWSDVYAIGATLYYLVTGKAPADALSRDLGDAMPMATDGQEPYRASFIAAIDQAMSVRAEDRPQSIAQWRATLLGERSRAGVLTSADATQLASGFGGSSLAQQPTSSPASGAPSTGPRPVTFDQLRSGPTEAPSQRRMSRPVAWMAAAATLLVTGGIWAYVLIVAPRQDEAQWAAARTQDTPAAYAAYLDAQPNGRHVDAAKARRNLLVAATEPVRPAPPPPTPPTPPVVTQPPPTQSTPPVVTQPQQPPPTPPVVVTPTPPPTPPPQPPVQPPVPTPPVVVTPTPPPAPPVAEARQVVPERRTLPVAMTQPEIDQARREVQATTWRIGLSATFTSDGYGQQSDDFIAELDRLSGGKLKLQVLSASDSPGTQQLLQGVQRAGTFMVWHSPGQSLARNRAYELMAGIVPFGLAPAAHVRWMRQEGAFLLERLYRADRYTLRAIPCGIAGSPGAWLKKDITAVRDLTGLKVAGSALMADALQRLGAVQAPAQDLRASFMTDKLDAWFGLSPNDRLFLRDPLFATTYMFPSPHMAGYMFDLLINGEQWQAMSEPQRRLIDEACHRNLDKWVGQFAQSHTGILTRIRAKRVTVKPMTAAVSDALRKAVTDAQNDEAGRNAVYKTVLDSYNRFRR